MNWKLLKIEPSTRPTKKLQATFQNKDSQKTVHFGARGYRDFTTITNPVEAEAARSSYWKRHNKDLKSNDPTSPGYLSLFILWGVSRDVSRNTTDYKRRFSL